MYIYFATDLKRKYRKNDTPAYAPITTANERFKKDMKEITNNSTIADTYITEFTGKQLANETKTRETILLVAKLLL